VCLALYLEDPGQETVDQAQVLRTLTVLRAERWRLRAVVAEVAGSLVAALPSHTIARETRRDRADEG
jgi:hypothetical protein